MSEVPEAIIEARSNRLSAMWIVPIVTLGILLLVAISVWSQRGTVIEVEFARGHGLSRGDPVRLRDVEIGLVEGLTLSESGDEVLATLRIQPTFERFMREGSRFWIQHPSFGFGGVTGLDTLLGTRYIGVRPGDGPPRSRFLGLSSPPPIDPVRPGDLEIVIEARDRSGMRPGGVVTYRGMPAGRLRAVDLAADATSVVARAVIDARYAPLVRAKTKFFATSGMNLGLSLSGLSMEIESLESLVAGGIAFATPPNAGPRAEPGARFWLAPEALEEWLEFSPRLAIGELGVGVTSPPPTRRATLRWETKMLRIDRSRSGWMLPVEGGVLVIAQLLEPPADVRPAEFVYDGTVRAPQDIVRESVGEGVVRAALALPPAASRFPEELLLGPKRDEHGEAEPELVFVWTADDPLPIPAHRLRAGSAGSWQIDGSISFGKSDRGAPVTSARTGGLVGLLQVSKDGQGKVAFVLPASPQHP